MSSSAASADPLEHEEVEAAGRETAVGSLYVKKSALGEQPPQRLRVTIEDGGTSS